MKTPSSSLARCCYARSVPARQRYAVSLCTRFSTTSPASQAQNRVFSPIRSSSDLNNLTHLAASAHQPLITLWTASWCRTCRHITPFVTSLLDSGELPSELLTATRAVANNTGSSLQSSPSGVAFATVDMDAPEMMDASRRYMVRSVPMLLSFIRNEPRMDTAVADAAKLGDRRFLDQWLMGEVNHATQRSGSVLGGWLYGKA